ncbi:type I restriction endonuclease subunit S [Skermanella pratensis]|uniref:restriction endonuclease subunit S n=1 Tax=Skermanella pratensis TaxID=2233999 RepID=UPI0013011D58|nr:type I restriction endonuclease subunit S [Skermanella pratensis]
MAVTAVPVVVNQDIRALTPASDVDPFFLQQQLTYLEHEILRRTAKPGTTVESIELAALLQLEVFLPPVSEQRAISRWLAAIAQVLNSARTDLRSVVSLLDAYKRAVLLKALSGRWDKSRPARQVTLGDIADIQGGLTLGKRYGGAELVPRPYLRVANVQRGWLDLEEVRDVLVSPAEAQRYKLLPGDILMNEGGDSDKLGRGWVWNDEIPDCIHQNHVFRARLSDREFPPEFISLYANELGRDYFLSEAKQTTNLASISKTKLSGLPIRLPNADDARAALRAYEDQTRWTEAVRTQALSAIDTADAAEASAIRKAFEGRLVPAARGEPAPTLLLNDADVRTHRSDRGRVEKGSTVNILIEMLDHWPDNGLTFATVRDQVPSDYESLKDAIFDLLAGADPKLEQRYSDEDQAMKFFRKST